MKILFFFCLIFMLLGACASNKNRKFNKNVDRILGVGSANNYFKGIFFYDPVSKDTLYKVNSNKYFTPASNTKIFTLYAALNTLPEKLPVLQYSLSKDTLYITGTGDATQLHPYFQDSTAIKFLEDYSNIAFYDNNLVDDKFGPGWAWEDFDWYYASERSALPFYGNVISIYNLPEFSVTPSYFKDSVIRITYPRNRKQNQNIFFFDAQRKDSTEIPYVTSKALTSNLLAAALGKTIHQAKKQPNRPRQQLYGIAADSVYKRMMQRSDNFLAEQLLIQVSSMLSDTLSSSRAREYVLDSLLADLRQPPRWVDGSGLSRYNLFSPESMVHVLSKMLLEIPRNRLLNLFAAGGESGTLEDWYPGETQPYIYAKTGTLGNNHCLSGYLITSSGNTLVFSFMNNHFRLSNAAVKEQMQQVLEWVRDTY